MTALANMTTKLPKLKLRKNDDPEDLEYLCQIDKKTRKAFLVTAAGEYYADVIRNETLGKGSSVTAEDLIEAMGKTYRTAGGCDKEYSDDDTDSVNETALVAGAFKYKC